MKGGWIFQGKAQGKWIHGFRSKKKKQDNTKNGWKEKEIKTVLQDTEKGK